MIYRFVLMLLSAIVMQNRASATEGTPTFKDATPPVPELKIPASKAAWNKQRRSILSTLNDCLGEIPTRPKSLVISNHKIEDRETYVVESFSIDNGVGAQIPAQLLLPKERNRPIPAILYCHWHGGEYHKGKIEIWQKEHTPHPPGPALVARGFAVLAIDAYCFGERNGIGPGGKTDSGSAGEMSASKFNLWYGRSLWGMILRDDRIALDYLCSRKEIDPNNVGVMGMSMGATRSWWLMAMDSRIKSGVAVACMTRYQNLINQEGLRYHGIYYYVPGLLRHFDTEAIVSLIAPRSLLLMNGDKDAGSPVEGIRYIETQVEKVYRLYEAGDRFRSEIYPGVGHEYLPRMWDNTLEWFEHSLK